MLRNAFGAILVLSFPESLYMRTYCCSVKGGGTAMSESLKKLHNVKLARVSTVAFFIDTQLHSQISALVESGADVSIVASDSELNRPIGGASYFSIDIPRQISLLRDFMALINLWRLFRNNRFDIVHSTTPKAGLLCALAGKMAGVPIRVHTYTGQPWVTLSGIKRLMAKSGDLIIGRLNNCCYTDSHSQRDFLISNKLISADKLKVLAKGSLAGVDVARFSPERYSHTDRDNLKTELGIPSDAIVFIYVGRIVKDKGVYELIDAFKRILENSKNSNIYLLMVGPQDLSAEELGVSVSSKVSRHVLFVGYTDVPEKYMAISDALCIPSYREGFGTVVIEAAAMGLPSIGSNIYGLSDAIVDGETGVLVEVKNTPALMASMEILINDHDLLKTLGGNARDRAVKYFSSEYVNRIVLDEYVDLIRRFMK